MGCPHPQPPFVVFPIPQCLEPTTDAQITGQVLLLQLGHYFAPPPRGLLLFPQTQDVSGFGPCLGEGRQVSRCIHSHCVSQALQLTSFLPRGPFLALRCLRGTFSSFPRPCPAISSPPPSSLLRTLIPSALFFPRTPPLPPLLRLRPLISLGPSHLSAPLNTHSLPLGPLPPAHLYLLSSLPSLHSPLIQAGMCP